MRQPRGSFNSQVCVSCREGGQLVCCDDCPASFHLLCHNPPLELSDLPQGRWICHRCENSEVEADENLPSTSEEMSRKLQNAAMCTENGKNDEKAKKLSEHERNVLAAVSAIANNGNENMHPFLLLKKAASVMNSSEFDLPPEYKNNFELPGSYIPKARSRTTRFAKRRRIYKMDNSGIMTRPLKVCFRCRKSYMEAPLIACDYCSALFHADCLDPPLTTLPKEKWMCPNHVEHVLDGKILKSLSYTERLNIWHKFARQPVDEFRVKLNFIRRCRDEYASSRVRSTFQGDQEKAEVPYFVKCMYMNPVELPSYRLNRLLQGQTSSFTDRALFLSAIRSIVNMCEDSRVGCFAPVSHNATNHSLNEGWTLKVPPVANGFLTRHGSFDKPAAVLDATRQVVRFLNQPSSKTLIDLNSPVQELICLLALERLKQISRRSSLRLLPARSFDQEMLCADLPVIAVLQSLNTSQTVPIQSAITTFGYVNCDVDLTRFGVCHRISPRHATLYLNSTSHQFELLCYSKYDVKVDGVPYGISVEPDSSSTRSTFDYETPTKRPHVESVEDRVRACLPELYFHSYCDPQSSANQQIESLFRPSCLCDEEEDSACQWEGSAVLQHGSVIEFGCLKFLFADTRSQSCTSFVS